MPKKSRIIVNNWSSLSDSDAMVLVSYTVEAGVQPSGDYPTRRYKMSDGKYYLAAAFRNKSSHSFDVRDSESSRGL